MIKIILLLANVTLLYHLESPKSYSKTCALHRFQLEFAAKFINFEHQAKFVKQFVNCRSAHPYWKIKPIDSLLYLTRTVREKSSGEIPNVAIKLWLSTLPVEFGMQL